MTNKANEPAFPQKFVSQYAGMEDIKFQGLTKRELGAFIIAAGLRSNPREDHVQTHEDCAKEALKQTDALLAELEKGGAK